MTDLGSESEVLRRRRAIAAVVLIVASVSVGVVVGRMSASIVPTESSRTNVAARQTSEPPKPLPSAAQPAPVAQVPAPVVQPPAPQPAAPQPSKLEIGKDLAGAGSAPASPTPQFAAAAIGEDRSPPADEPKASASGSDGKNGKTSDGGVTVINPAGSEIARDPSRSRVASERSGADTERVAADAGRADPRTAGFEECERRYSSFRREDGTYQPYGGGPRIRCPHLR